MALNRVDHGSAPSLYSATVTTAGTVTGGTVSGLSGVTHATLQAAFTYGSGGTTAKFYVQNSVDGGTNWYDVAAFAFTTATANKVASVSQNGGTALITLTDGSLADDTAINGAIGNSWRVKQITTGTYAGSTSVAVTAIFKG